jgi:hypothetical protein
MGGVESNRVSLAGLGSGAAMERFGLELQKVLENIADPNFKATSVREIRLTVRIAPNESADYAAVSIECESRLPKRRAATAAFFMGTEGEQLVAYESKAKQQPLTDASGKKIIEMGGRKS